MNDYVKFFIKMHEMSIYSNGDKRIEKVLNEARELLTIYEAMEVVEILNDKIKEDERSN